MKQENRKSSGSCNRARNWDKWLALIEIEPRIIPFFHTFPDEIVTDKEIFKPPSWMPKLVHELEEMIHDAHSYRRGDERFSNLAVKLKRYAKELEAIAKPVKVSRQDLIKKQSRAFVLQVQRMNHSNSPVFLEKWPEAKDAQYKEPNFKAICFRVAKSYGVRLDILQESYSRTLTKKPGNRHWTEKFSQGPCKKCGNRVHLSYVEIQDIDETIHGEYEGHNVKATRIEGFLKKNFPGYNPGILHANQDILPCRKVDDDFILVHPNLERQYIDGKPPRYWINPSRELKRQ